MRNGVKKSFGRKNEYGRVPTQMEKKWPDRIKYCEKSNGLNFTEVTRKRGFYMIQKENP